jgi:ATP-dependent helicase HrpA
MSSPPRSLAAPAAPESTLASEARAGTRGREAAKSRGRESGARPRSPPRPLPPLRFPEALPVSARRDEIAAAIRAHPVVIVSGETGSGKTTQLPKICAMAGRGASGLIGHTQPRRIAATAVARRIAEELGTPLGANVGYKIRFNEKFVAGAAIKLMTDGILLAETQTDPLLRDYDTIIVDEAHERSLNIDFLLGYLKQLVEGPRRDDLRIVITSATIDAERFARHFGRDTGRVDAEGRAVIEPAPVIEVSGRLYPVEIRWQGFDDSHRDDDDEDDLPSRIDEAIESLWREAPGDVLVFLPGEREIRDSADHLRRLHARESAQGGRSGGSPWARGPIEILPLYSRLSAADQQRVFSSSQGRRIVLATNVAETSLTVPGIRYVVDSGLARVKRYRYRSKVEQLQIEPVSQAAANQRAGRCGRVMNGVCIRLYDQADFEKRPRFTDPEVLRSSLASVILRMKALRLPDIDRFPFLDPPPRKAIVDGFALLHELGAVDDTRELTQIGRTLARLPLDPRVGRMLLAAHELGSLREVLVIASALSAQDPRERPPDAQQAADQAHRRFADERSDFGALLKIWEHWHAAQKDRESNRKLAAQLEREFLSARRLRDWADVHNQLAESVRELHWKPSETPASYEAVHRALLSGLLGNLGFKPLDEPLYAGTHQTKFAIHPGSYLTKKAPRWIMAAELVETGRLYARMVARVEPAWIEQAAEHLIQRSWSDPSWSKNAGQVIAHERGVLYGLTVYAQRRVNFGPKDPRLARELMIREALVGGDWDGKLPFYVHNRRLVAEIEKLEHKIRRPDLLVDEAFLFDWYDRAIPAEVWSAQALEHWWRQASKDDPKLLHLSREALLRKAAGDVGSEAFPRRLSMAGVSFELDYRFEPGAADDGVTMTVPIAALNQVDPVRGEWLVPGMLKDKVQALLKSLPQRQRRHLVPLPERVLAFVERSAARAGERPLVDALIEDLREHDGLRVQREDFRFETLPPHLLMNYRLVDAHGSQVAASRSLPQLKADHGARAQTAFQAALAQLGDRLRVQSGGSDSSSGEDGKRRGSDAGNARPRGELAATEDGAASRAGAASQADGRRGKANGRGDGAGSAAAGPSPPPGLVPGQRFTDWSFGRLPELLEIERRTDGRRQTLIGFPAMVDRGDSVELQLFDEPSLAQAAHRGGLIRLFALALKEPLKFFERNIPDFQKMSLQYAAFGSGEELKRELVSAVIERACLTEPLPDDGESFAARLAEARPRINLIGQELARALAAVLVEHQTILRKLQAARAHTSAAADVAQQLEELLPKHFVSSTPAERWRHLPRYLKAIASRLDKLRSEPTRDAQKMGELTPLLQAWRRIVGQRRGQVDTRLEEFRWLLEELRVSLFAQELRTPMPVSVKRLQKALEALRG